MTIAPHTMADIEVGERIARLDFASFRGLGPKVSLTQLLERYQPIADRPGRGQLGAAQDPAQFWTAKVAVARQLRIWFIHAATSVNKVVRIDLEFPVQLAWREQRASWGQPDAREDYDLDGVVMRQAACVWARHGLAILSNEEGSSVTNLLLFERCSLEHYRQHVYTSQSVYERPF